ncbi:MAG: nuclear transport factor 2 family protein [Chloroflexia bacterium]|nr:nuclear transport factor 2 family protein [Chloroflexia bacterium]
MGSKAEVMEMHTKSDPLVVIERIRQAINRRDLDALAECFDANYRSEFPAHPDRAFGGHDQMRANWGRIFRTVPDIEAVVLSTATDAGTVWVEWEWTGTYADSSPFLHRGVTIQGVRGDRTEWVRLYMEPVQASGPGIGVAATGH